MGVGKLLNLIERGRGGKNIGISTGNPKLDSVIFGLQKKYLYTVGADTSGGKTSFSLDTFVYNLIKNKGDKKVSILYFSFEMSAETLYAKLLSRYIYDEFHVVISYKEILSMSSVITDEQYQYVQKAKKWLYEAEKSFVIYDRALTPEGIYATTKEWLSTLGKFEKISEHREIYVENDPEEYKVALLDHVGLIGGQGSKKERIDKTVDYFIYFRNKCDMTGIFIQQLNRNAKAMDRKTNGYELIQLDDFKDTSGTTDGSDVVLGIYFPYREKIATCEGYPIKNILKKRFRLLQVLKNRYGEADLNIGMAFYGEIGMFRELPRPEEIGDYEPYLNLDYTQKKDDNYENENVDIFKF